MLADHLQIVANASHQNRIFFAERLLNFQKKILVDKKRRKLKETNKKIRKRGWSGAKIHKSCES